MSKRDVLEARSEAEADTRFGGVEHESVHGKLLFRVEEIVSQMELDFTA